MTAEELIIRLSDLPEDIFSEVMEKCRKTIGISEGIAALFELARILRTEKTSLAEKQKAKLVS